MSFANLMMSTLFFLLILVGAFRLGLALTDFGGLLFGLLSCYGVLLMLSTLEYSAVAARLYDIRQGKRLFSFIGSGEVIAKIAGACSVPLFVGLMGVKNLLLLSVTGLACSLGVLVTIVHAFPEKLSLHHTSGKNEKKKPQTGIWKQLLHLAQNRYLALMGLVTVVAILGKFFLDFAFLIQVQTRYNDAVKLAGFFAMFSCITQVIDFIGRISLSGKFFNRYGIKIGLITLPSFHVICTLLIVLTGSLFGVGSMVFWLTVTNQGIYKIFRYTIDKPSFKVLYQPLRQDQRLTVQIAIEGIVTQMAVGAAGIIMLVCSTVIPYNPVHFSYVMLFALVSWFIFARRLAYREYPVALKQALTKRSLSDTSLVLTDSSTVAVLKQGLTSPHVGVVLYSLDMLEENNHASLPAILAELLDHSAAEIRLNVLQRVERLGSTSVLPVIRERLRYEGSISVRGASLRTLAALGDPDMLDEVYPYLQDPDLQVRREILIGLLRNGDLEGILAAGEILIRLVNSPDPVEREFAARVLGEGGIRSFYRPVLTLLRDEVQQVQRAALVAAGKLQHPKLWPTVVECLHSPLIRTTAVTVLAAGGEAVLPELQLAFSKEEQDREVLIRLARICGRIRGEKTIFILQEQLAFPDGQVRTEVLLALSQCDYRAREDEIPGIQGYIKTEIAHAVWTLAALIDIGDDEVVQLLKTALHNTLYQHRERLLLWLSFLYDPQSIHRVRENLSRTASNKSLREKQAYALEILDVLVSPDLKTLLIPLFDNLTPAQCLQRLSADFPQQRLDRQQRLQAIINGSDEWLNPWTKSCALETVARLSIEELSETVMLSLSSSDSLVRETAGWTLFKLDPSLYDRRAGELAQDSSPQVAKAVKRIEMSRKGEKTMLSTLEKVIILKAVNLFAETSEEALVEVAAVLDEVESKAEETIIHKGEPGSSMYIIVDGQVRVHDKEQTLTRLGENEVFGDLSVLNSEPRSASVTALEDTRLLRLDQEPFYEIIEDHNEIARSIIQLLVRRLQRVQLQVRSGKPTDDVLSEIHEKLL